MFILLAHENPIPFTLVNSCGVSAKYVRLDTNRRLKQLQLTRQDIITPTEYSLPLQDIQAAYQEIERANLPMEAWMKRNMFLSKLLQGERTMELLETFVGKEQFLAFIDAL